MGCAAKVDRLTVDRVLARGMTVPDVDKACELGASLYHAIGALGATEKPPHVALLIADATGAICQQQLAWEADLTALRALKAEPVNIAEVKDARLRAERYHGVAALRFWGAFQHTEAAFGPVGEGCKVPKKDEVAYAVGLVAGMLALFHDKAGNNSVGVPLDTLPRVARGAECLSDEDWWHLPSALQGAAWATIPGSGPEGTDPWGYLEAAAEAGEQSGVRVARAISVLIASNADQGDYTRAGIESHANSLVEVEAHPQWRWFDSYALAISRHASDGLWTEEKGHRTPSFGQLPQAFGQLPQVEQVVEPGTDPFEGEPDPFGPEPDPFSNEEQ